MLDITLVISGPIIMQPGSLRQMGKSGMKNEERNEWNMVVKSEENLEGN